MYWFLRLRALVVKILLWFWDRLEKGQGFERGLLPLSRAGESVWKQRITRFRYINVIITCCCDIYLLRTDYNLIWKLTFINSIRCSYAIAVYWVKICCTINVIVRIFFRFTDQSIGKVIRLSVKFKAGYRNLSSIWRWWPIYKYFIVNWKYVLDSRRRRSFLNVLFIYYRFCFKTIQSGNQYDI